MRNKGFSIVRRHVRWTLRMIACVAALGVAPAHAGFPGKPGQIVFSSTFSGDREIFVAAADGSGRVDLTRDPHADVTPSWSADGKRIAFASDRGGSMEIYLMNADGSAVTQLTHDSAFADHPRMTADGRYVVYESKKGGNWEIRRIGVDGSGEVDLTRNRASDRYAATSPNGRLIAFSSNRGRSGTHIWVMNIRGSALKQVTVRRGNQFEPAWAPAGGRLAYVSGTLTAGMNIWTVLANGKGNRRLTMLHGDEQLNPSWSPDGRSIVYENCEVSNIQGCTLSVMAPDGIPLDISSLRAPFLDTFDGGDTRFWQPWTFGTGAATTEANGKLTTTLSADSAQGGQYDDIEAHWGAGCRLAGDFDVQVDYQLLEWPAANGVQAEFLSYDESSQQFMAMRESQTYGEQYTSWIPQSAISQLTSDLTGTLRLQRQGSTAVTSRLSGATWVPIASGPTSTSSAMIALGASSTMNRFSHQEVKFAWDNFRINSGTIFCATPWWGDGSPDWQATPA